MFACVFFFCIVQPILLYIFVLCAIKQFAFYAEFVAELVCLRAMLHIIIIAETKYIKLNKFRAIVDRNFSTKFPLCITYENKKKQTGILLITPKCRRDLKDFITFACINACRCTITIIIRMLLQQLIRRSNMIINFNDVNAQNY